MSNGSNSNWQKVALVLFGLLIGSGTAGGIGHFQYSAFAKEVRTERMRVARQAAEAREKLEAKIDAAHSGSNSVLIEMGKLAEKVDGLTSEVNRLRDRLEN